MEILSSGEKIKKIRKQFKIRQQDITGGKITRELISIIENDKSKLTPAVAQIVTDNINKICKEKSIDFNLNVSYLLEDKNTQVNKIADKYINFLNTNEDNISKDFTEDIIEIENFLLVYDIPEKKMIIYEKIGDILKNQKNFDKSYTYYIKAFEHHNKLFNDIKLFKLINKISNVCLYLTKYKESIDFNNLTLIYNEKMPKDLKYKMFFNNILAYIYLKQYNKALTEITHIENTFNNLNQKDFFELNILRVNCLRWQKFYTDALELNEHLLNTLDNNEVENILLITANILDIYTVLKDMKNVKIYLNKVIYQVNNFNNIEKSYHAANTYRQIGISANLIGNIELSKKYYKNSINACKYIKNLDILKKSLDELLNILIKERNSIEINDFKNEVIELISLNIINSSSIIILKIINYYNSINDNKNIQNLLDFILDEKNRCLVADVSEL